MIPNAIASTGPYAGLWSHLKSIDHALHRVLNDTAETELTELDQDRLRALLELLEGGKEQGSTASSSPTNLLSMSAWSPSSGPNYTAAIDLRQELKSIKEFEDWHKPSKIGFEVKLERLIQAVSNFLDQPASQLFKEPPREELQIVHVLVKSLLRNAEAELHS